MKNWIRAFIVVFLLATGSALFAQDHLAKPEPKKYPLSLAEKGSLQRLAQVINQANAETAQIIAEAKALRGIKQEDKIAFEADGNSFTIVEPPAPVDSTKK